MKPRHPEHLIELKPVAPPAPKPIFGLGRRCFWCAKYLRAWQISSCQVCSLSSSPPCRLNSRRDSPADSWRHSKTFEQFWNYQEEQS